MVARQVTVDVKGSHLFVISQRASRRVRKPSPPSVNGCCYSADGYPSSGSNRFTIAAKQTSTTSSLRSCASRASGQNLSMTQNKIAPITTIIRIPITSVSTATSLIVAAMSASLPSDPSVEEPKNDQKQDGTDGGADNGRRDPGAGVDASLGH